MERLSSDYIRGYTKAIQDIEDAFVYVQEDLTAHKKAVQFQIDYSVA